MLSSLQLWIAKSKYPLYFGQFLEFSKFNYIIRIVLKRHIFASKKKFSTIFVSFQTHEQSLPNEITELSNQKHHIFWKSTGNIWIRFSPHKMAFKGALLCMKNLTLWYFEIFQLRTDHCYTKISRMLLWSKNQII